MHRAKLIQLVSLHPVHKGNSMNPLLKVIQLKNYCVLWIWNIWSLSYKGKKLKFLWVNFFRSIGFVIKYKKCKIQVRRFAPNKCFLILLIKVKIRIFWKGSILIKQSKDSQNSSKYFEKRILVNFSIELWQTSVQKKEKVHILLILLYQSLFSLVMGTFP